MRAQENAWDPFYLCYPAAVPSREAGLPLPADSSSPGRRCRHQRAHVERCAMPHFTKLTPNLLVASVERSLAFYVDTLGFSRGMTVPDQSPFVFGSVTSGAVEIFFNDAVVAAK